MLPGALFPRVPKVAPFRPAEPGAPAVPFLLPSSFFLLGFKSGTHVLGRVLSSSFRTCVSMRVQETASNRCQIDSFCFLSRCDPMTSRAPPLPRRDDPRDRSIIAGIEREGVGGMGRPRWGAFLCQAGRRRSGVGEGTLQKGRGDAVLNHDSSPL
eukprot:scaffold824_cov327-Pavlova_lutheri.AAC.40